MNTKAQLEAALKDAMRAHDEMRKRTLRMVLSSVKLAEVERGAPLDDAAVMSIVQKEVKSRQEVIEESRKAGRLELAEAAEAEAAVLESFLPQPLTEAELAVLAQEAIEEVGASTMREMGQVMRVLMPRLQGRATGDQASQAVRKQLQA